MRLFGENPDDGVITRSDRATFGWMIPYDPRISANIIGVTAGVRGIGITAGVRGIGITAGVRGIGVTAGVRGIGVTAGVRGKKWAPRCLVWVGRGTSPPDPLGFCALGPTCKPGR